MVGGMERYYQIARCYRDEDFRADRQPEFTQLDIEMSFVTEDDVIDLGESDRHRALEASWPVTRSPSPIPRITWHDAMARYGSDKPDLRFGVELTELTDYLRGTEFRVFAGAIDAGGYVGAVVMPGGASQTRKELDGWQDWAKARGARGLAYVVLDAETGEARGPVAKNLSAEHLGGLADAVGAKPGDAIFFAAATEHPRGAGAARRGPPRDRQAGRPDRRRRLGVLLGRRRADVRADRRGRLDGGAPPVHLAERASGSTTSSRRRTGRWRTRTTSSATATRSAAARSVSTAATCRAGSSTCSASRRAGGAGQVRLPAGGVQVRRRRRTAASPSAGTGSACCSPARTPSAR